MPPASPNANALYHEWGLMAAILAACVPLLGCVLWLVKTKRDPIRVAILEIRSALSRVFQDTVLDEALRVFQLVDDHLPYALGEPRSGSTRPSAFDQLCGALRGRDEDSDDRVGHTLLLKNALSGIIVDEVKRLFMLSKADTKRSPDSASHLRGLQVSFEGSTEISLEFIAKRIALASGREAAFYRSRSWAPILLVSAAICGLLFCPTVFVNHQASFWTGVGLLAASGICVIAGLVLCLVLHCSASWLEDTAADCKKPGYVEKELAASRGR